MACRAGRRVLAISAARARARALDTLVHLPSPPRPNSGGALAREGNAVVWLPVGLGVASPRLLSIAVGRAEPERGRDTADGPPSSSGLRRP